MAQPTSEGPGRIMLGSTEYRMYISPELRPQSHTVTYPNNVGEMESGRHRWAWTNAGVTRRSITVRFWRGVAQPLQAGAGHCT